MPTAFVTGANRGIGLEFTRQLLARGYTVHATHRNDYESLAELNSERLILHQMDVRDDNIVEQAIELIDGPLDLLVNNAAIYDGVESGKVTENARDFLNMLDVNTVGPYRTVHAAWSKLSKASAPIVAMVTTGMASMTDAPGSNAIGYRTSKAALNMLGQVFAHKLRTINGSIVLLCPGWVATDMGGHHAALSPQESVSGMLSRIDEQGLQNSGRFVAYDGTKRPW